MYIVMFLLIFSEMLPTIVIFQNDYKMTVAKFHILVMDGQSRRK